MHNPRLAARYAKSLIDVSLEQKQLATTLSDMQQLNRLIGNSREFAVLLRSPVIKADKKNIIIDKIIGGHITPITKAFITLLVNKGREANLQEIAQSFIAQYKEMQRIKSVKLTSAAPLNDTVKENIRRKLATAMPLHTIELQEEINPELIGGFVLQVDDKLFDASVRRDLQDIRAQFTQNLYVQQLS